MADYLVKGVGTMVGLATEAHAGESFMKDPFSLSE